MADALVIQGLRLRARVGAEDAERAAPQLVVVDAEVGVDASDAARRDDLAAALDYTVVLDAIEAAVTGRPYRLLETMAARVADALSALPGAGGVTVEIAKEVPPVRQEVGRVAVRTSRGGP